MPQANSTFSRPRATSPSASAMVFPFSRLMNVASWLRCSAIKLRRLNKTSARRDRGVDRHSAAAAVAAATARSTSSTPAKPTSAMISPVAGLVTAPLRPEVAATGFPLIQCEITVWGNVSVALITFGASSGRANPIDGLRCQLVESSDGKLQMVFLRIFNLIVADPFERLHKEHRRRNAGSRNFSSIVQRAGRQAMGTTCGFANRLFAAFNQSGVKWLRRNVPDARPFHGAAFLFRELSTLVLGLAIHSSENLGAKVALIEGHFAAANDSGDDTGKSLDTANGADSVRMLHGDGPNLQSELCGSCQRIAPRLHGR